MYEISRREESSNISVIGVSDEDEREQFRSKVWKIIGHDIKSLMFSKHNHIN